MLAALSDLLIPISLMLFFAAVALTVYKIKSQRDIQRKRAMESLAYSMGLPFLEADSLGLEQQLKQFDLFKRGRRSMFHKRQVSNIMRSTVGETEVFLFDYSYVVSTGKSTRRITQTVFFANDKKWYLPNFRLRPERWWHKVLAGLGIQKDINFEDNQAFSDSFWLKSEFEGIVRQKFTPELQQFLLEKPPVHLEGENYYLLAYKPGKKLNPDEAKHYFETCCDLTRLLQTEGKLELLQLAEIQKVELLKTR